MAKVKIEIEEEYLKGLEEIGIPYIIPSNESIKSKYLEVPSIGLAVSKERILFSTNFYDTQKKLQDNNTKMLNMNEFKEFLKEAKEKDLELYNSITQVRSPWRAEWIDADFKYENGNMFVVYHVFDERGNIFEKREKLDRNTLLDDRTPGISLENWINNSTKQGLPKKSINKGDLYYWSPDKDNNSVARFGANGGRADLSCYWIPSDANSVLGVRAAKQLQ